MPKATQIVSFLLATSILVAGWWSFAEKHDMKRLFAFPNQQAPDDSSKVSVKYKPSRRPANKPKGRYGDPLTNKESKSPMQLKTPDNIKTSTSLDTTQETFEITEKAGEMDYRPPTEMNFKDYAE